MHVNCYMIRPAQLSESYKINKIMHTKAFQKNGHLAIKHIKHSCDANPSPWLVFWYELYVGYYTNFVLQCHCGQSQGRHVNCLVDTAPQISTTKSLWGPEALMSSWSMRLPNLALWADASCTNNNPEGQYMVLKFSLILLHCTTMF